MPKYKIVVRVSTGRSDVDDEELLEESVSFPNQEAADIYAEEQCIEMMSNMCESSAEATLIDQTVRFYLVKSSSIVAFGYDSDACTLGVIYRGSKGDVSKDRLYVYKDVAPGAFEMLLGSPSFGKALIKLRGGLEFENMGHPERSGVEFEWCVICPHCSESKIDEEDRPYKIEDKSCLNCDLDDTTVYPWYTGGCEKV